jgi:excinuclease ABC subunit A
MLTEPKNSKDGIILHGVSTNNLKNISVNFPIGKITSVTGVSGSGKTSLVFDTLYAESYRRYVESLSSYARQYIKALPKPAVDRIENLLPAIAVKQTRSGASNRSTVGTMTEMLDALRNVFSNASSVHCVKCHRPVIRATPDLVWNHCLETSPGSPVTILAPLADWAEVGSKETSALLLGQGFSRIWSERSGVKRLEELKAIDFEANWIVVDRCQIEQEAKARFKDACQTSLKVGRGDLGVLFGADKLTKFSRKLQCCSVQYVEPTPSLFNFNNPVGACEQCQGFGSIAISDETKVIPDINSSLDEKGIAPWNFGEHVSCYELAVKSISLMGFSPALKKKAFSSFSEKEKHWLWNGDGKKFYGIHGYFKWLDSKRYKPHYRIHAARFRKYVTCPSCQGDRLNYRSMACRLEGKNLAEVLKLDFEKLVSWVEVFETKLDQLSTKSALVKESVAEMKQRLSFLDQVGLSYLSLDRSSSTLSGGELQRLNLSRCLGSQLTETLFCLDEPTAGLHARDVSRLFEVIRLIRDSGNTVVLVEHDRQMISKSDFFIEIGPQAGHEGGKLVYMGIPTIQSSRGEMNRVKRPAADFFHIEHCKIHNLKSINAQFALGRVNVVCGVSGSGKTSLVKHSLVPLLKKELGQSLDPAELQSLELLKVTSPDVSVKGVAKKIAKVEFVSQSPLGRSSRSTIATYLGIMDDLRKLLSSTETAKLLKLTPGSFSFNVPGGRCETCKGLGTLVEDLSFLGEMEIVCPSCNGQKFQEKVLSVKHNDLSLLQMLRLTVKEARTFFSDRPQICKVLDAAISVGLGYLQLGQSTSSFSGGEAQRMKLIESLVELDQNKSKSLFVFDEPSTGLSDSDVLNLMNQFRLLTEKGHTVVIVEHHLSVIRMADWVIELGPDSAHRGGEVVYQGVPEEMKNAERSVTRMYL